MLVCNEPTGALDSTTGRMVLKVLQQINQQLGATVLSVTHAAATAAMADRVIDFTLEPPSGQTAASIHIYAPISGRVLRLMQESAATLPAGTAVMELGNIEQDLEVIAELLPADAVQATPGDKVVIQGWGGATPLYGEVERVDPRGFSKVSALGVEKQRGNTIIGVKSPPQDWHQLGHGFRIEVQIVIWAEDDALLVPSSALFRDGSGGAVFAISAERAVLRPVEIGRNNGVKAQVLNGLQAGDRVILSHPPGETGGWRGGQSTGAK